MTTEKIFVIGGHMSEDYSLHKYFLSHNLKSIHGNLWIKNPNIIKDNFCFSDHFAELINPSDVHPIENLVKEYPNSKFILNYRSLKDYTKKICEHLSLATKYSPTSWSWLNQTVSDIVIRINNTHFSNRKIVNYFKKNNLMSKLLVLRVDHNNNTIQYLLDSFLKLEGKKFINISHFSHVSTEARKKLINEYMEKYVEVCKNISIKHTEYDGYLDNIYFNYSFPLINDIKKTIYMTYKKKIPSFVFERWLKYNKEYDIDFNMDNDCIEFLKLNFNKNVSELFLKIDKGMYKADLWRICKLYLNTGVYADVDLVPYINLEDIDKKINFYTVIAIDDPMKNKSFFQAFMINNCMPKHPLFLVFIISFLTNKAWTMHNGPCYDMYNCVKYIIGEDVLEPNRIYYSSEIKIKIYIGDSEFNSKMIDLIYFPKDINYTIELHENPYNDTFSFEIKDNKLIVTRTDSTSGWGHYHNISIFFPGEATFNFLREEINYHVKNPHVGAFVTKNGKRVLDSRDPRYFLNNGW